MSAVNQLPAAEFLDRRLPSTRRVRPALGPRPIARPGWSSRDRQQLYAAARQRDMGEVAFTLKTALRSKAERKAFVETYKGHAIRRAIAARACPDAGRRSRYAGVFRQLNFVR